MEMRKQRTSYSPKTSQSKTKGNAEKKTKSLNIKAYWLSILVTVLFTYYSFLQCTTV